MPFRVSVDSFPISANQITVHWTKELWTWVDYAYTGTESGTFSQPFNSLAEAQAWMTPGSVIQIKTGSGSESILLNKSALIRSYAGDAVVYP